MIINNVIFNCELSDIIQELQSQLQTNGIPLLQTTLDSGNDIMVACPYHKDGQERRPSAGIRKSDGKFHCFACQQTHELQEVISHCFGHYEDALGSFGWKWLNKNFASVQIENRKDIMLDYSRDYSKAIQPNFVSKEELAKYRRYHPYWKKRGITDERLIELFDLGYDADTDCITMPVRDRLGNCLFVARRSVRTKWFNYPKGVQKPLYGLYEFYSVLEEREKIFELDCVNADELIICESMIDALTAWHRHKFALALNGLGTEFQFELLRELPCRKLILATDMDSAGVEARYNIRKHVTNKLITEYVNYPKGCKDINDMTEEQFKNLDEVF